MVTLMPRLPGRGPEWLRHRGRKRLFLSFLLHFLNLSPTYVLPSQKIEQIFYLKIKSSKKEIFVQIKKKTTKT